MPDWITQGYHEYAKRLPTSCRLQLIEIPAEKRSKHSNLKTRRHFDQVQGQTVLIVRQGSQRSARKQGKRYANNS